jgi:hypothetical protein
VSIALPRLRISDPGFASLKTAARAAIVIPAVFAFADKVVAKPQTSILAAFGSFALLVLTEFAGSPRTRLLAYLGLACVGTLYITLGTLCSRHAWLAAVVMAAVGFVTLFSGVINGYFAAGATGAILTFVLPVTIPAPNSAIPDRLEGWGIACAACISAALLLWPPRARTDLQRAAAQALRSVADVVGASPAEVDQAALTARSSVEGLGRRFLGAQHRPGGPTKRLAALTSIPAELGWLLSFLAPAPESNSLQLACAEDAEAMAAIAAALRASADRLDGGDERPDFDRLDSAKNAVVHALLGRLPELPAEPEGAVQRALDTPFRIRSAIYSAHQLGDYALLATGADSDELASVEPEAPLPGTLESTEQAALEHANPRDVWFQNSVRGAVGLAIAVYIADRASLQHGFWVVLGTLSVLRSNALGTGWSILSALAGTAVGLVIGSLLVIGIGTHDPVLWGVLPAAVLLAAYAPRAISFAAGQAGFTVTLFVLFNLIQPVGWRVGVVRIEDIAIGFGISLGVGLLFWPRGAGAVLRSDLAAAYERAADYVVATTRQAIDGGSSDDAERAARAADAAAHRLDDAFAQYLAERSATAFNVEDVAALVGGASRVRRSAQSLASLGRMADGSLRLERCGANLDRELQALQSWYVTLGYSIVNERRAPPPHLRDAEGQRNLLACLREAASGRNKPIVHAALILLWVNQHLDNLWRLEEPLGESADIARADAMSA